MNMNLSSQGLFPPSCLYVPLLWVTPNPNPTSTGAPRGFFLHPDGLVHCFAHHLKVLWVFLENPLYTTKPTKMHLQHLKMQQNNAYMYCSLL